MKLHVMYDKNGKIMAAIRLDGDGTSKNAKIGSARPVVKPGYFCADLDVPAEHAHLTFAEACRQLMVETNQTTPHLKLGPVQQI
jgi:hypothetical protein